MSTEDFFDQVARTLAEPMPRRRAVRLIGISLAVAAVPGIRPVRAHARTEPGAACSHGTAQSNPYENVCNKILPDRTSETYCCGPPKWQYGCGDPVKGNCADGCPPRVFNSILGREVPQYPCTATKPDAQGQFRGQCCARPDYDGCFPDGKCRPNCPYLYLHGGGVLGPINCGKYCCATYQACENGECISCEGKGRQSCQPLKRGKGETICCKKGTNCCANNTSTDCCGPKQKCGEQKGKATCACKKGEGTKCGSDCCNGKLGETCCSGLAGETCCKKGEECCFGECCSGKAVCCEDDGCCDPTQGNFCLRKKGKGSICKKGCVTANQAGGYCCGTGYKPNPTKTGCVLV